MSDANQQCQQSAKPPEESPWDSPYFRWGILLTIVWVVCGSAAMLFLSDKPTWPKPNEWGDIFAGLFAPVAFLWLILGYVQQGKELQLNTRVLELQVAELNASVTQQKELVAATQKQVATNLEAFERERKAAHENAQPRFVFHRESIDTGTQARVRLVLTNEGATVSNLRVSYASDHIQNPPVSIGAFTNKDSRRLTIILPGISDFLTGVTATFNFNDGFGGPTSQRFQIALDSSSQLVATKLADTPLTQVEADTFVRS